MKAGKSLTELAQEIERQRATKRDFLADTRGQTLLNASELHLTGQGEFGVTDLAHGQIADHLGIPRRYYERLRQEGHASLLDTNVNTLFRVEPASRLVRTLDGRARAFLSDRYRRLDHEDLVEAIMPPLSEIPGVEFPSCEITDSRLYIKALSPSIQGEIKPGDIVQAGVVISNSEVGLGSLTVSSLVYRLICKNGLITEDGTRRTHVGRRIGLDDSVELFRDETKAADDRAFWLMVRDVVAGAVTQARFDALVDKLRATTETEPMVSPSAGVRELAKRFSLDDGQQASVLHHLTLGGDLSQWGAINAVTRTSQDVADYDEATRLETTGGAILAMGASEWRSLARMGATV